MKNTLSLNGEWQLTGFEEGQGDWSLAGGPAPEGAPRGQALVPGEVHLDLLRAGVIPDPYYAMNAEKVQWVEEKEWWYRRAFDVPDDFLQVKTFLEFQGLDTFAAVFLNGQEVGRADNMFIPHRFDVTELIRKGENVVAVRFDPAARVVERTDCSGLFGCFHTPRVTARKMQCSFGWDWTPRLLGAGVWRDVALVSYDAVSISDIRIDPEMEAGAANAWITIEIENHTTQAQQVMASIVVALGENREKIEVADVISPFGGVIEAVIRIEEPVLWWPSGMGEQPLYDCLVGLDVEGRVQDAGEQWFGVRTVEFIERDEDDNPVFTLLVNGEKVFCKGGNWIPADHFVGGITEERYRELVRLAADANFNMLRVWGGGIYESPAFYKACDEMGIMVWQDFMFSCGTYPDDEDFSRRVAAETEVVVKQLRNHPCIVVWCGNNECEMNAAPDQQWRGRKLFHEVIPDVLRRLDRSRPYRPCSPYGGATGNDAARGDVHGSSWFKAYLGDASTWRHMIEAERGLFVSEFVTQGPPMIESLRRFIPEDELFPPTSEVWEYHNRDNPHSNRTDGLSHQQILVDLTRRMMGEFDSVGEFAAYAGILQGEFLKAEAEHYRREKWGISGGLMWMYNDCWPAVDWSTVDYYLRPKIAYYYAKRAFAPVIVSFKQLEDRVWLYVTSDDRIRDLEGRLDVGVFTFDSCGFDAQTLDMTIPANTSQPVWESPPLEKMLPEPTRQCLVAVLAVKEQVIARNVYFARLFGEMEFPEPKLLVQREQVEGDNHRLIVSADAYARNVEIGNVPAGAQVSDNFFDLLPGEMREVIVRGISREQGADLNLTVWRR